MRVLFAGVPAAGHLFPLVPLATAVRDAGHDVVVASLDGGEVIAASGLPFANIAPGVDWRRELRALGAARRPDLLARTVQTNSADREAFVPLAALVNELVADQVVDLVARWRADVVVHEYLFPVAALAAAKVGVPVVQHDLGFGRTESLRALMFEEMRGAFERHGVVPPSVEMIDIAPPSMVDGYGWPLRPVPYNGGGDLPAELAQRSDRPRVAVTLGTVPPKVDGLSRLDRVVAAAADVDAEFVLVMGGIDIGGLGPLPPNVRPLGWVPWDALVATCDATVHHGGSGTALTTLGAGIPQLVLPDGSDRFVNADAVRARGAGLTATAEEVDADLLRTLLTDPKLQAAATEVAAEIAAMPPPAALVPKLTGLL